MAGGSEQGGSRGGRAAAGAREHGARGEGQGKARHEGPGTAWGKTFVLRTEGREKRAGEEAGGGGGKGTQRGGESSEQTQPVVCGAQRRSRCPHAVPTPTVRWTVRVPQFSRGLRDGQGEQAEPVRVGNAGSAEGGGCPWLSQLLGADLVAPGESLEHGSELLSPSSHLHFLSSPDKVTIDPPGSRAVCAAPRSPLGWTRAGAGMRPGRFVQTQALHGPPRSLVW